MTATMNEEEFLYFNDCRQTNFLANGKERLLEYLGLEKKGFSYIGKHAKVVEFISYLLCRLVGNIVNNIIRKENHGILKQTEKSLIPEKLQPEIETSIRTLKRDIAKAIRSTQVFSLIPT